MADAAACHQAAASRDRVDGCGARLDRDLIWEIGWRSRGVAGHLWLGRSYDALRENGKAVRGPLPCSVAAAGEARWSALPGFVAVIFVTVGTQLPFERLVAAVDEWVGRQVEKPDILVQVGSGRTDYANVRCVRTLDAAGYASAIACSRLMVAHAGTGSILAALDSGIPIIVFPRDSSLGEHRDDHQFQTARQMERMGLVTVAWSVAELVALIERELAAPEERRQPRQRNTELVDYLRDWLRDVLRR